MPIEYPSFDAFTAVQSRIQVFWNATLRHTVRGPRRFEGTCRLHLQSSTKIRSTHSHHIYLWFTSSSHTNTHIWTFKVTTLLRLFQPERLTHVSPPCLLHNPPNKFFSSLIIRIIIGEDYKQCSSSLCNFSCQFLALRSKHAHQHPVPDTINHPHSLLKTTNCYTYEGWNFNSGNYLFTTDTK